jgi:hypothetical protein
VNSLSNSEFIDHIEACLKNNGGQPVMFTPAEVNRLRDLAGAEFAQFRQMTPTVLGSSAKAMIRAARKRIIAAVAARLTGERPTLTHVLPSLQRLQRILLNGHRKQLMQELKKLTAPTTDDLIP